MGGYLSAFIGAALQNPAIYTIDNTHCGDFGWSDYVRTRPRRLPRRKPRKTAKVIARRKANRAARKARRSNRP